MARPRKVNTDKLNEMNGNPTSGEADVVLEGKVRMETPSSEKVLESRPLYAITELNEEMRNQVLDSSIRAILDTDAEDYQGGTIPSLIKYDLGDANYIYVLFDIDYRVMKQAWEYYSTNVQGAKYPDFVNLVRRYKSPDRLIKKVAYLDMA